jgi:hypothetical protein
VLLEQLSRALQLDVVGPEWRPLVAGGEDAGIAPITFVSATSFEWQPHEGLDPGHEALPVAQQVLAVERGLCGGSATAT